MTKNSAKPLPADLNRRAAAVVALATAEGGDSAPKKNPAAVALGRLGGLKGGPARAAKLSKERLKEIATEAARKRHGG